MKLMPTVLLVLFAAGCGIAAPQVGVLTDTVGVSKARLGPSPEDVPARQYLSSDSLRRAKRADVAGDDNLEILAESDGGRGLEIRDPSGQRLSLISTDEYLTDFGAVPAPDGGKQNVVLYTYPNAGGGGTFRVATVDGRQLARWEEEPAPALFTVGAWKGAPALFYLQGDELVVRSTSGELLSRLAAPEGRHFQAVRVSSVAGDRTILLASGGGYTPFHMVSVYDRDGRLVFQEIAREHAFELEVDPQQPAFVVVARSSRWQYDLGGGPAP
jgi:hypothetical protein